MARARCGYRFFFFALFAFFSLIVILAYRVDFPFLHFQKELPYYSGIAWLVILIVMSVVLLFLYRKYKMTAKKRQRRRWIAGVALAIALLTAINPLGTGMLVFLPPVYSETDDPGHYLVLGYYPQAYFTEEITKLFPAGIPRWTRSCIRPIVSRRRQAINYYDKIVDSCFHIYAEWALPQAELELELQRIQIHYPKGPAQEVRWGDWICLSFTDDTLDHEEAKKQREYTYFLFAYNERTHAVRYIASYCQDGGEESPPYFLRLSWE